MIIIKSEEEIIGIRESSKILIETFEFIKEKIVSDVSTKEIDELIENFILGKGATPAFKGYRGFPASACISVNETIIHGIPDGRNLKSGDIVGLDIGVKYRGFFSDAAYTFGVGKISKNAEKLLKTTKRALYNAISISKPGNRVGDISNIIQRTAERNGYNVVREFVGHGVGRKLHEDPPIPNFGIKGIGPRLKSGMTIAIEPMINEGTFNVELLNDGWTVVTEDRKLSAHFEHTILIKDGRAEILTDSSLYKDIRK